MFAKLYGRMKDQESLQERPRRPAGRPARRSARLVSAEDRQLLDEHATFVREMEQELQGRRKASDVGHAVPELEPGVKDENDNMPKISKMQIDLMVNSFAADFARVATLQYHQLGRRGPDALARHQRRPPRAVAQAGQRTTKPQEKLTKINKWYCEQLAYLAKRLAETPGAGRQRQPARQHADRLDQRAGQGQLAHARQHPVRAGRQRPRLQDGPLAQVQEACRTTGCCCRWPTASATTSRRFGNPDFCGGGVLPGLT